MADRRVAVCVAHGQSAGEVVRLAVGLGKNRLFSLTSLLSGPSPERAKAETANFALEVNSRGSGFSIRSSNAARGRWWRSAPAYDRTVKMVLWATFGI